MNRSVPAIVAALALVGLFAALGLLHLGPAATDTPWPGKTLRVGWAEEYPYAFRDEYGHITGEAPETARAVLAALGITGVDWVLLDFSRLIQALEDGDIDMIAAGMFATPERAARIDFSLPTVRVGQGLLVRAGNPKGLSSYDELASRRDVTTAVLMGSVEEDYLKKSGVPASRLFAVPDAATGAAAVLAGRADGLALSGPTVRLLARDSGGALQAAWPFTGPVKDNREQTGLPSFGFRKADTALRHGVDTVLRGFIGSAEHLRLVAPFGFTMDNVPEYARNHDPAPK